MMERSEGVVYSGADWNRQWWGRIRAVADQNLEGGSSLQEGGGRDATVPYCRYSVT